MASVAHHSGTLKRMGFGLTASATAVFIGRVVRWAIWIGFLAL
jgi:hypothetical protein